ncbi:MAG: hypothetical protein P1P84_21295 [Deferrisomatales bacterium]|nr:hypothetical protein [Deferrisomatales bacterium]
MVLEWLLGVCLAMIAGIYGVFWRESRGNRVSVHRHDLTPVPERGPTPLYGGGLGGLAVYDRNSTGR